MSADAVISAMRARGFSDSDILGVISEMEKQRKESSREANAERQRRFRERNASNAVTTVTRDSVTENPLYKENASAQTVIPDLPTGDISLKIKPTVLQKTDESLKILSECLPAETAAEVVAYRKSIKAPITPGAAKGLVKQFLATGDAQSAALEYMAAGYRGYFPKSPTGAGKPSKSSLSLVENSPRKLIRYPGCEGVEQHRVEKLVADWKANPSSWHRGVWGPPPDDPCCQFYRNDLIACGLEENAKKKTVAA